MWADYLVPLSSEKPNAVFNLFFLAFGVEWIHLDTLMLDMLILRVTQLRSSKFLYGEMLILNFKTGSVKYSSLCMYWANV